VSHPAQAQLRETSQAADPGWKRCRLFLVLSWLVLLAGAVTLGERPAEGLATGLVSMVWGKQVPPWLGLTALASTFAALACLIRGPEPWRATRWAWFWLMGNPFGLLAFLLLSGPTPGLRAPRTSRRLRGGWALVISSAILTALLSAGLR
jgi:hypothetical protein